VPPFAPGNVPVTPDVKLTLVMVLLEPLIVLLVSVSVVARPTNVSVAAGSVNVPDATALDLTIVVPEVVPAMETPFFILNSFAISFHFPRNED